MIRQVVATGALALLLGCTQHHVAGNIGPHEIHVIQAWHVVAPSSTETFIYNTKNEELRQTNQGIGGSVLGFAAMPVAVGIAAHEIGEGIGDSGDEINHEETTNNTNVSEGSVAKSDGAVANNTTGVGVKTSTTAVQGTSVRSATSSGAFSSSQSGASSNSSSRNTNVNKNSNDGDGWTPPGHSK